MPRARGNDAKLYDEVWPPRERKSLNQPQETNPMTDLDTFIRRIDQELGAEVQRQKGDWPVAVRGTRERASRLQRYEAVAQRIIELLKPRLAAFIDRFKDVVKAEPSVREHTRAMTLTFAATVAKVTLR